LLCRYVFFSIFTFICQNAEIVSLEYQSQPIPRLQITFKPLIQSQRDVISPFIKVKQIKMTNTDDKNRNGKVYDGNTESGEVELRN
jgi:hypothetical protein